MQAEYGDQVNFVGVGGQDSLESVQRFIEQYDVGSFPHVYDADDSIRARFGPNVSRSTFYFLDDDGTSEQTTYGSVDESGLRARVEALIAG